MKKTILILGIIFLIIGIAVYPAIAIEPITSKNIVQNTEMEELEKPIPGELLFGISTDIVWDKTYGGRLFDDGNFVIQTNDGGYIFCGVTLSYAPSGNMGDAWVVKTDLYGNIIWNKTYGGKKRENFLCVQQTSDGGYILTGYTSSFGAGVDDLWLMKIDSSGKKEWDKTYGCSSYDNGVFVKQTSDEGYIIVGRTEKYSTFEDIWLIKTDNLGNLTWDKAFNTGAYECGFYLQQTTDGGYIIVGDIFTFYYPMPFIAGWAIKTDNIGNIQWDKKFWYGTDDCTTKSVCQTSDGGYIIAGGTACFGTTGLDAWLIKLDETGSEVWNKTYGVQNVDEIHCVQQTTDSGFIFTSGADGDLRLVKTDNFGTIEWDRRYGGSKGEVGLSVQQTSDGGYIVGGTTLSYGGGYFDFWLIKTDENGKINESNHRPDIPMTPSGPTDGEIGVQYIFNSSTNDSDGDMIFYWFDWDDGDTSGWIGPFSSGETVEASHMWTKGDGYKIHVKAMDEHGREGEWSEPFLISIKKSKSISNLLFLRFLERYPLLNRLLNLVK